MRPTRVALLCDYPEEGWASMDLVAEMILSHLRSGHGDELEVTRVCPPYRRRLGDGRFRRNADRLLNRHLDYPRHARKLAASGEFDLYHVVDHSYAQLVDALPTGRTVVTCHDLDTFRCLLDPAAEPRPYWFRAMTRRTLRGLQNAAAVAVDSEATRRAILRHGLIPEGGLHLAHLAVHPECSPEADAEADAAIGALLGPPAEVEVLHVGTNIARKRVDVLLRAFAEVRRAIPGARLLKAGGALPADLSKLADDLGIAEAIMTLPHFSPTSTTDRARLASVYRRAALTMQPSDAEGFGLPVAESLACGTPVLASDIEVLREVGGDAATYAPVGDVRRWVEASLSLLAARRQDAAAWGLRRERGLARASLFRWEGHASRLVEIYRRVVDDDSIDPGVAAPPRADRPDGSTLSAR